MVRSAIGERCVLCARVGDGDLCGPCRVDLPAPLSGPGLALCGYDGAGRDLVLAIKRGHGRVLARALGAELAGLVPGRVDRVTWAPTSLVRRRQRGYDQSRLLATAVAAHLGVPVRRLLERRIGAPQAGHDRAARLVGPRFVAVRRSPPVVLVVDDVITTGATMRAAVEALTGSGARVCIPLLVARTP